MSELRWNPVLEEWVITATHRQDRTFLPPKDFCPLCPTRPGAAVPTEVPAPVYEIVTFENKFPSLRREPPAPEVEPTALYQVRPAQGVCEVVLYTPQHDSTLTQRSVRELEQLIQVWTDRYLELGALGYVKYVLIFENKGTVIGVTLTHPHGQIYAFPFVPPKLQKEVDASRAYRERTGGCLFCDIVQQERADGRRIVWQNERWLAVIPFYARWPYEVHLVPKAHCLSLADLTVEGRAQLAQALKAVLVKYDNLWQMAMPYMMAIHQAPTDGGDHGSFHLHVEFYPPHRTKEKLKYLASVETSAGTFINDTLPEETAAELRAVEPARPEQLR
jgi:UDPglucose--hexose-1-phosphate uridylyltransferase